MFRRSKGAVHGQRGDGSWDYKEAKMTYHLHGRTRRTFSSLDQTWQRIYEAQSVKKAEANNIGRLCKESVRLKEDL